jgi:hypothetical protein
MNTLLCDMVGRTQVKALSSYAARCHDLRHMIMIHPEYAFQSRHVESSLPVSGGTSTPRRAFHDSRTYIKLQWMIAVGSAHVAADLALDASRGPSLSPHTNPLSTCSNPLLYHEAVVDLQRYPGVESVRFI